MIDEIVKGEFGKFKENNPDKYIGIEEVYNPHTIYSDITYTITENDKDGKPIHRIAEIEVEDLLNNYRIDIQYREMWYPSFSEHAKNIKNAFDEKDDYEVTVSNGIKK